MSDATSPSQGSLTGHKVRFDGLDGRAGTYNPELGTYSVTMDSGFTRTVEVKEKFLEDFGSYRSPIEPTPGIFGTTDCANSTEGNPHTAKYLLTKPPVTPPLCSQCQIEAFRVRNAPKPVAK